MANMLSLQKNSLKPNAASHNNTSWYTDTDGFLEHSPSRRSLYYKGSILQKIILVWGAPLQIFMVTDSHVQVRNFFTVTLLLH